jgi:hypothetical protein
MDFTYWNKHSKGFRFTQSSGLNKVLAYTGILFTEGSSLHRDLDYRGFWFTQGSCLQRVLVTLVFLFTNKFHLLQTQWLTSKELTFGVHRDSIRFRFKRGYCLQRVLVNLVFVFTKQVSFISQSVTHHQGTWKI